MRVLFLTLYPETAASPRYRVHQYIPYLEKHGVDCTVACPVTAAEYAAAQLPGARYAAYHGREIARRIGQIRSAKDYDLVYLQKGVTGAGVRGMTPLVRRAARKLVFDYDDAVHLNPPVALRAPWNKLANPGQVAELIRTADTVVAGNTWLANEAVRLDGLAVMIPTAVDAGRFTPAAGESGGFRVGWIGSPGTAENLREIAPALDELDDAEVVVVGADPAAAGLRGATGEPWAHDTEVGLIQSFAVGVMPLMKTEWNRGKCALKALQYMACGVPCIATPFGAVTDIIEHGANGLLADSEDEWRDALARLRDPEERRRLGEAGRRTVEEHFSIEVTAPRLLDVLERLA